MSVVITIDDIRAYAEVDYIINHMNQKYIDKVPKKILAFFADLKDPNYDVKVDPYVPLQNQGLKRYTLEIIALLHLKYWCEDEERKKELYGIMLRNQEKLEEQMRDKYSVDKLFGNSTSSNESVMQEEKEDFTKPRVVQRYSSYTEQNSDIQDFTDHIEVSRNEENNLVPENEAQIKTKNIFERIKEKIFSIFNKKAEKNN